jgi:hypothetical protein
MKIFKQKANSIRTLSFDVEDLPLESSQTMHRLFSAGNDGKEQALNDRVCLVNQATTKVRRSRWLSFYI